METKPYDLQSPESIAKEYGGDKRKIAQAAQLGVLDATAAVMAGMFIDRMRSAAALEQQPQPTVAQQVMGAPAAPAAPAGLGATAPAAAMPAAPMAAPPMGMAGGGLYDPPYMNQGGLSELPLPAGMFDEPDDGSYAPGGIVAFATGDEVPEYIDPRTIEVTGKRDNTPLDYYKMFFRDPEEALANINAIAPRENKQAKRMAAFYEGELSPEAMAARKKENMWMTLAELGANLAASKSGNFFGALGEAGAKALPGMAQRTKEMRSDKIDAMKTLAADERLSNKEALDLYNIVSNNIAKFGEFDTARLNREQQEKLAKMGIDADILKARIMAGAGVTQARIQASTAYAPGAIERIISQLPGKTFGEKYEYYYNLTKSKDQDQPLVVPPGVRPPLSAFNRNQ